MRRKHFGQGLICLIVSVVLSGCGQAGALYLSHQRVSQANAANDQVLP